MAEIAQVFPSIHCCFSKRKVIILKYPGILSVSKLLEKPNVKLGATLVYMTKRN